MNAGLRFRVGDHAVDLGLSTVTAADGTFALAGVPPGTYTVEAWHEVFGTKTATVTVAADAPAPLSIAFGGA